MSELAKRLEIHVSVDSAQHNAVDLLHDKSGLSKQKIKSAMTKGAVWVTRGSKTRRLRRAKRALAGGDELHLYYDADVLAAVPAEPILLADAGGYSVWHKPYGVLSQGSKWGDHCTVVRWAEQHLHPERSAFTVHRLDRAASGILLVAHAKSVAAALSALFSARKMEKHYLAVVVGDFSQHASPVIVNEPIDKREALSEISFQKLGADGRHSLVNVRIESGRKHQIRRHLASLGHPVRGDRLYGTAADDDVDLQLTACFLAFHCPVNDVPVEYSLPVEYRVTL